METINNDDKESTAAATTMVAPVQTNFFTALEAVMEDGLDLTLTLRKDQGKLVVGVRPNYDKNKTHPAMMSIRPMLLQHPAIALDESFFMTITTTLQMFKSLNDTISDFAKQVETAKATVKAAPAAKAAPAKTSAPAAGKKKSTAKPKPAGSTKAKPTKAKAPAKPKVTPEEKDAKLKSQADVLMAEAEKLASKGMYHPAILKIEKAQKIRKDPAQAAEREKIVKLQEDAKAKKIADEKQKKEQDAKEKKIKAVLPLVPKALAFAKSMNYAELPKLYKQIIAADPDNIKMGELRADLVAKLGEGVTKQLLG